MSTTTTIYLLTEASSSTILSNIYIIAQNGSSKPQHQYSYSTNIHISYGAGWDVEKMYDFPSMQIVVIH